MTCNETARLIPDFLKDELDIDTLESFITHIESCSDCMEELTIMALVTEGLNRLEDGSSFNVNDVVNSKINAAVHRVRTKRRLEMIACILAISAVAVSAAGIFMYISIIGI
ncbi:MAG: zf-HC2 domain-containing protein [Lachnospiraceae bacterium]|jgi:hypothetical protein|nr:zf-HC2 domain-containing protein [Lachnospiraceae bacterium]